MGSWNTELSKHVLTNIIELKRGLLLGCLTCGPMCRIQWVATILFTEAKHPPTPYNKFEIYFPALAITKKWALKSTYTRAWLQIYCLHGADQDNLTFSCFISYGQASGRHEFCDYQNLSLCIPCTHLVTYKQVQVAPIGSASYIKGDNIWGRRQIAAETLWYQYHSKKVFWKWTTIWHISLCTVVPLLVHYLKDTLTSGNANCQ